MGQENSSSNPSGVGFVDVCGYLVLGGVADWRLPSKKELVRIVDYDQYNPAMNALFSVQTSPYWTSTTRDALRAWHVRFYRFF